MSYERERIENWVSDFLHGDGARRFTGPIVEYAHEVLTEWFVAACAVRGTDASDLCEEDLRAALLSRVAGIEAPASVRQQIPDLCGAFLESLEAEGRLGGGRKLGVFVRALRDAFVRSSGGGRAPERRVAPKIGGNEPCPCGSGQKFKRCCQR